MKIGAKGSRKAEGMEWRGLVKGKDEHQSLGPVLPKVDRCGLLQIAKS
jgi:hypothetical protein